ncbi:ABC transporter ATP-binding protein [Nocardioides terrisoli]|uniref:ABC transporter ATP-binding protein n=1 Tax=Nocardioides terrisoli TaxID=3388267 RepID=UPI00287B8917|nr:ATP-binding cassette domain-containing protein [Nocardioides marmorisolisilvae]
MPIHLEAAGVSGGYGPVTVVRDLTLAVQPGEVVALLGPNGAGKSTTLRLLSGVLAPTAGEIRMNGRSTREGLHRRARSGVGYVSGEKPVFSRLTVAENLRVSGVKRKRAIDLFPELESRWNTRAGSLSGGEQQMLGLARTLGRGIQLLLADELSLGLAPLVVERLLAVVRRAADEEGVAVINVEQHVDKVLKIADRAYVMRRGHIEMEDSGEHMRGQIDKIAASYLTGMQG